MTSGEDIEPALARIREQRRPLEHLGRRPTFVEVEHLLPADEEREVPAEWHGELRRIFGEGDRVPVRY